MGILFYFYAYRVAKEQADASNYSLIQTVKNTCDRELEYYENALIQLALNKNVQQLSAVRGEFRSENSSVLPIRTKYCLISSGPVLMTGEESFMLQLLRPWIF